ncbi:molybdate ABC transporter permease subunit [Bermanella sp. WJH001]|uniref:molybdate ABC transporter permease subunit n=1 Tax=Bermanella sp. WJH001 TaxID=3048005 RepID=UPI0024BDF424|nr:molybdate ABC transporter permease subunit [Bermanella sp. WJH001]MDJ1539758.1 molybdate ABC transporter permease subunit [Bermanella sp. WJH001]
MDALLLTLKLAFFSTAILIVIATPIAWFLAHSQFKGKFLVEALIALPLVLPPTVLGFYLLIALGPQGPGGWIAQLWDERTLAFSFTGLLIGSIIYSLPFVVQPLQNGFSLIGKKPLEVAYTLNASFKDAWRTIIFPLAKSAYISAATLGFAHTLGEFGVVLMIGGNIPGETQVISIKIFEHVEALQYNDAHIMSAILLSISFVMLTVIYASRKNANKAGML